MAVYSSGPVTPLMQKAPSRRAEKKPRSHQNRAVSTKSRAVAAQEVSIARNFNVFAHGKGDVRVDMILGRARGVIC